MKNNLLLFVGATTVAIGLIALAAVYYAGYSQGRKSATIVVSYGWDPKSGEQVATILQPDGRVGDRRIVTLTNVVNVGTKRCQTGILVYGEGLPGVDSSWVKPAP